MISIEPRTRTAFGDLPDLMTRQEVADYTGLSVPTLARWHGENVGPKSVVLGTRARRYRKEDVRAWLDSLEVSA